MKIAYLLGSLNRGGTETLLLDVFKNAAKSKLNAIGIYRKTGILEKEFRVSGVPTYFLPVKKTVFAYILKLRRLLRSENIQIVHAQQALDAIFAKFACIGTDIKVILTMHGYDFNESKLSKYFLKYILGRTNANFYVSNTQLNYYKNNYHLNSDKQKVVYNGISFKKFENQSQLKLNDLNIRNEFNFAFETLLLGMVGNFVSVRDQFTICKFLKLLNDKEVDFNFLFVGKCDEHNPSLYDECFKYVNQNGLDKKVQFLGNRNDVPQILNALDAFIYSTDHDTFGIAVVEAMACGIPIFVNNWEVMTEITVDGKYATLYKTKDEHDLLQQFMLFLQNNASYQEKALEAARFVRESYSIEKHILRLKEVYETEVSGKW